jgi:hypothetical protein
MRKTNGMFKETELTLKRMQTRLREEEMSLLRGDKEIRDTVKGSGIFEKTRHNRPHGKLKIYNQLYIKDQTYPAAGRRKKIQDSDSDQVDSNGSEVCIAGSQHCISVLLRFFLSL